VAQLTISIDFGASPASNSWDDGDILGIHVIGT